MIDLRLNLRGDVAALFVLVSRHQEEAPTLGGFLPNLTYATLLLAVFVRVEICSLVLHDKNLPVREFK